jgi:demethylspheroidene O-methyltransferase
MTASLAEGRRTSWHRPTWWLALRERLIASAGFQRWAAMFPLTRPVARRYAQRAFDLCAGFVYSQILAASLSSGILEALTKGPQTSQSLANLARLRPERLDLLLHAGESLELFERRGAEHWGLGPLGAALAANPGALAMVRHHDLFYADLADPMALLRERESPTRLGAYWSYAKGGAAREVAEYSTLMAGSQPLVADEILEAWDFRQHRRVLDVGGGEGAFLARVAHTAPNLELALFDLPEVVMRARQALNTTIPSSKIHFFAGSFLADPLPDGADLVTLVRVAHDHEDAAVLALFKRIRAVLPTGGRLLVAEPMSGPANAGRMADAYLAFYLLAMGQGHPRTPARLCAMLREAGFGGAQQVPTRRPLLVSVVVATV